MLNLKNRKKKWIAITATTLTISALLVSPVRVQAASLAETYLAAIAEYTYGTLKAVNNLPAYLNSLTALAIGWLSPDESDATANLQSNFSTLTGNVLQNMDVQAALQQQFVKDFFGSSGASITPKTLPYANDLTYQTLLGQPYFVPDPRKTDQTEAPDSAYNYTKNASGMMISHVLPSYNWRGNQSDQKRYASFYNTIIAVQTFNAYITSQLYADYSSGNQVSKTQMALMQQASNSDWFSQVASENIGIVLRQILMYNSQIYVTLSQLLDTEKKMLQTQAMNNTLLILLNQQNEDQLLRKATQPTLG